jgi:hypothetical protein
MTAKSTHFAFNPNERFCPVTVLPSGRAQVTCPRCGLEHEVCELSEDERMSVEESLYGEDTLTFECREGCGKVKGIVWVRR